MTWGPLLNDRRLKVEPPSKAELDKLRSIVTRSRSDVGAPGLSADTRFVLAYDTARHMRDPLTALPLSRDAERAVRGLAASVLRRGVRTRRQLGDMKALRRDAADILAGGAADGRQ